MNLLEEEFPDHKPLMPTRGTPERARADILMKLEREYLMMLEIGHGNVYLLK